MEKEFEEKSMKVDLRRKNALCCSKWSVSIKTIAAGSRCIWPPSLIRDATSFETLVCFSLRMGTGMEVVVGMYLGQI